MYKSLKVNPMGFLGFLGCLGCLGYLRCLPGCESFIKLHAFFILFALFGLFIVPRRRHDRQSLSRT